MKRKDGGICMQKATLAGRGDGGGGEKSSLARPVLWRFRKEPSSYHSLGRRRCDLNDLPPMAALALRFGLAMRKSLEPSAPPPPECGDDAQGTLFSGD
ncbi:Os10g0459575 [Oryza sativa Japonica Group]|uniref:Os10g0459575 protein n=1 Tax=Oryza sativa subsp. japonica TaxID=39947 RepID=A0A0P0XUX0_ORYSJ|nr:Os10g0459575 [Oryza sativa Japonica Group]